jgi:hypothetical protein
MFHVLYACSAVWYMFEFALTALVFKMVAWLLCHLCEYSDAIKAKTPDYRLQVPIPLWSESGSVARFFLVQIACKS